jgi:hypothetical protein
MPDEAKVPKPVHILPAAPPPAPGFERREKWVPLPAPYAGWQMYIWINHPSRYSEDVDSYDEGVKIGALGSIFLQHNEWPDPMRPGEVLPPTNTKEFWEKAPEEALSILFAILKAEKEKIPNSIGQKRSS